MSERRGGVNAGAKTWLGVVGAVAALALAVMCWNAGRTTSTFAPLIEGAPPFEGTHYDGLWISGAGLSVLLAGLMMIDVIRRLRMASVATS
ncbi:hypothetical protein B2J88_06145 [Rhodococcus sp. SRB_17]|uniref:hypothetical protein n=1 Tax=Rhodococcus sp. OK302 TaxID=1882769 RepID=UPI000B93C543|nr:hypothetical protein [Rhodococcus sp. OK302]NMM83940.1 hypothetical protein [Rhodococcus sp. SRB_17]OYD68758.1 hypothetical protein BDB13_2312 [Rhodococcus sp. OK302]